MNTGMLWFDNDPKIDLQTKINKAVDFYQRKYGVHPDLCFVHPTMLKESVVRKNGVEVKPNRRMLPNHFWIGIQEASLKDK
jgi:hypothetical protein